MRPVVIGSGPNGLSAAFYLAKAGRRPIVLERSDVIGGGAISAEIHPGFHAPIFSHEVLLHASIAREMNLTAHGLRWLDCTVDVCAPARNGRPLVIYRDAGRTADAMRDLSPKDADAWPRFRDAMSRTAGVIAPLLASAPPGATPGLREIWELITTGRRFRSLGSHDARSLLRWLPMPVFDFVHEWFEDDRLRALVAAQSLSGTMLGPRSAGSTLVLLLREAHRHLAGAGQRRAAGGPGACTRAMAEAARAAGAEIRTRVAVEQVVIDNGRVSAVVAGGQELATDLVISTLDPRTTLLALVDRRALPADVVERVENYRAVGTMAKVNLALSALPRFTGIDDPQHLPGHVHIGAHLDDLERAFDAVKYGEMSARPWLDVQIPSILDASLAPAGMHVASIYVHNAPHTLRHGAWATERDELLKRTLAVLDGYAPRIAELVLSAHLLTPSDLETSLGTSGGHIFHGELAPDQLFAVRPTMGLGRYRTSVGGLYLGGAGTHPGGFCTGASGRLAALAALRSRDNVRPRVEV